MVAGLASHPIQLSGIGLVALKPAAETPDLLKRKGLLQVKTPNLLKRKGLLEVLCARLWTSGRYLEVLNSGRHTISGPLKQGFPSYV